MIRSAVYGPTMLNCSRARMSLILVAERPENLPASELSGSSGRKLALRLRSYGLRIIWGLDRRRGQAMMMAIAQVAVESPYEDASRLLSGLWAFPIFGEFPQATQARE